MGFFVPDSSSRYPFSLFSQAVSETTCQHPFGEPAAQFP